MDRVSSGFFFYILVFEDPSGGICRKMALMKGEPLVRKLAVLAKYVVLPGAMAAALVYSPPDYAYYKNGDQSSK